MLDLERPDVIINAAAVCNFDRCEDDPALSEAVNLRAAAGIAEMAGARGMRAILFSSDYIFDGSQNKPYGEDDSPRPRSVYAAHKAGLERAVREMNHVLVARCAWIFGRGGSTFMSRMPPLMMEREELTVAAGKRGSCLQAGYGAEIIFELIEREATGLVNLVHAGDTAWEEFAQRCLDEMRTLGLGPRCRAIREVPFREMAMLKPGRPAYSVLATDRLQSLLGREPMRWETGLRNFLEDWRASAPAAP